MNLVKISSIGLISCILLGCSKPNIVYKTEYETVNVPVVITIDRPNRPVYSSKDSAPTYLIKLLEYTKTLEVLIDEHNTKGTKQ